MLRDMSQTREDPCWRQRGRPWGSGVPGRPKQGGGRQGGGAAGAGRPPGTGFQFCKVRSPEDPWADVAQPRGRT